MAKHKRQEIAEAILNELHYRRYNEAIANGCDEKDAMTLADNWELYKDAQMLLASDSESFSKDDLVELGGWFDGSPEFVEEVVNDWLNSR